MNRFLLGALAMGAFVVLTPFAVATRSASARAVLTTGPLRFSDLTMDRAFRVQVPSLMNPIATQAPATGGVVISQVMASAGFGSSLVIDVNGTSVSLSANGNQIALELVPPIIVRPNDIVTISSGGGGNISNVTLAGYTTLPGET